MTGTIPLSMTQQMNEFGEPLSGGKLYIIQAGTVATPQQPYQDYNKTVLHPNPIPLDAAGRIPQFFLDDGFIKIRLDDRSGVTQLSGDFILVVGPSSGGGGGGGVDPTTIFQTGQLAFFYGLGQIAGYVRCNARTIGSATSGATERANADCQALFQYLWGADSNLAVSGGRGASAVADWTANKTMAMPDCRGRGISCVDDHGTFLAGRLTGSYWGSNGIVLGQTGGDEKNLLTGAQSGVAPHAHNVYVRDRGHGHNIANFGYRQAGGAGIVFLTISGPDGYTPPLIDAAPFVKSSTADVVISSVFFGTPDNLTAQVAAAAAAAAHPNMHPTMLAGIYLKL